MEWNNGQPVTAKLVKSQHGSQQLEITGLREEPLRTWHQPATPLAFMSQRSLDVCGLLISGKPHHLLSVPTHSGGWIDPVELVTRINELTDVPPDSDVILALLRLAPEGRKNVLRRLDRCDTLLNTIMA